MARMWMVRSDSGALYDTFRERGIAAIGWGMLASKAAAGASRQALMAELRAYDAGMKQGALVAGASQVWRFVNEIQVGDHVISYSPQNRVYMVGTVSGSIEHRPEWIEQNMALVRATRWQTKDLDRDDLRDGTRNSLGSTLTIFEVPSTAADDIMAVLSGKAAPILSVEPAELTVDLLADVESQALERIKDRVNELDWDDMQQLVAGILRAMGYKTQVSPPGSDRGKDIVASPDGFGFEHPRIVVEVKHRKGQMGSHEIRGFLGGRHKDDRGLYVSTGGFSKDAQYEADRASIPLAMWTLDHVVRALIEHYDATDAETKRIVPLKRLYWPA